MSWRPSLAHILIVFFLALVALLLALLQTFDQGSRRSLAAASDLLLVQASGAVEREAQSFLERAERVVATFVDLCSRGYASPKDLASVERVFSQSLVSSLNLGEVGLTYAEPTGRQVEGVLECAARPRLQLTVYRPTSKPGMLVSRRVFQSGKGFVQSERRRSELGQLTGWSRPSPVKNDPCEHYTFTTPLEFFGEALWSDLHWCPRDLALSPGKRGVELSVQQAVRSRQGRFLGVVRVSLRTEQLDGLVKTWGRQDAPLSLFLCDTAGRLLTRVAPGDPVVELEDALRIQPRSTPPQLAAALAQVRQLQETPLEGYWTGRVQAQGRTYLVGLRPLKNPPDWMVGVTIPEDFYLGSLDSHRRRAMLGASLIAALVLGVLGLLFWRVRRDLASLVRDTARMQEFSFEPGSYATTWREVHRVADGLERAKTALRTLSKYTPVAVVREIIRTNREPSLGGETREVTLLFTDVEGFTTLAERLGINETASLLGDYLEVMGGGIQSTHGTVLEYVGDAIVAVWNAPGSSERHPAEACEAVLACRQACQRLYSSPAWGQRPPLVTRFGVHTAEVVVGHFGALSRMSYRVVGDGANLASRIEGLNKLYGTEVLLTGAVVERLQGFDVREIDWVVVKGRQEPVALFELLGRHGQTGGPLLDTAGIYAQALQAYRAGQFGRARDLFEACPQDPPSRAMAERCRGYLASPPQGWDGVYRASEK